LEIYSVPKIVRVVFQTMIIAIVAAGVAGCETTKMDPGYTAPACLSSLCDSRSAGELPLDGWPTHN
jgi:hypothetical protein